MARALRDINVGIAMMVGVASGYYIYEPLIRHREMERRKQQEELEALAAAVEEPVDKLKDAVPPDTHAPFTRWLLFRK